MLTNSYTSKKLEHLASTEKTMSDADRSIAELYEKKNAYESFIYATRRNAAEKYVVYST
jgi:hypothetical protein